MRIFGFDLLPHPEQLDRLELGGGRHARPEVRMRTRLRRTTIPIHGSLLRSTSRSGRPAS